MTSVTVKPRKCRRGTGRLGMSLIECLTIMVAGAALTGIVISGMAAVMRYDRNLADHNAERDQLQSLVERLRDDVHLATKFRFDSPEHTLRLAGLHRRSVAYRWFDDHGERTVISPGSAEHTTRFRIPPSLKLSSNAVAGSAGDLLRIIIETTPSDPTPGDNPSTPAWHLEVVAMVGRDLATRNP